MKTWITTACSAAVLALGVAAPSIAQQTPAPAATQQAPVSYSDSQLEKFVAASKKVAVISQEYTPKLQATTDDATRQEVYREADEKMVQVVRDEGMTVEEFNGINQAIQQDPALMERVQNIAR
ncbi:MAG TPA: DUF4168 domain-containing protein [Pusillimonas sp.]|uniref:DUF4168 domain-containing protein n=1 Tax=unclassified Pusillimonas TaxID=2640016 RepID=UPI00262A0F68|nr:MULTISPECIES: DUF4168 domain-containing protein [unclassified Pusillimonas]HLU20675.1 DUF4168 domain-containing protein [Pusillimonas sp.]